MFACEISQSTSAFAGTRVCTNEERGFAKLLSPLACSSNSYGYHGIITAFPWIIDITTATSPTMRPRRIFLADASARRSRPWYYVHPPLPRRDDTCGNSDLLTSTDRSILPTFLGALRVTLVRCVLGLRIFFFNISISSTALSSSILLSCTYLRWFSRLQTIM